MVDVPAGTERLAALFGALALALTLTAPAHAQEEDDDSGDRVRLTQAGIRFATFGQTGRGIQSQSEEDANIARRGSEEAWIFQPIIGMQLRQDRNAVHNITIPVDIVTAASPDALDAITTASRENEAVSIDVVTTVQDTPHTSYQLHIGSHFEEYWGSGSLGGAIIESFADDNATLRVGVEFISDSFDGITPEGVDPGPVVNRFTSSLSASISQLLSPTTIVSGAYSFTAQFGHLETTYNSVPTEDGRRIADRFPRARARHTLGGEIRQAIRESQTYFGLGYRFYVDGNAATAHTSRFTVTQYIGDVWLRGHYRFHIQEAPSFWMAVAPANLPTWALRTADSDLEDLHAQEVGLAARIFFDRAGALTWNSSFVELTYNYYWRSNSLESHVGSFEIGFGY